ncbi:TatD family hydrolase [Aciditerrimonas ferrireducens]|uniref:TatD family hydrolase n=1 Tax=Aciditerrimonas ferrireducens TaxID=667306 RepID=UPI002006573E|nr:TatD family hydrolase [Aciditerrimonas ferrireducens]MCK4176267.1 TatD family hydrolase [Aciditerrimonas ferrireducens]
MAESVTPGPAGAARVEWLDAHCHLQDRFLEDQDWATALAEAAAAGVRGVVCVGTDEETSRAALAVAEAADPTTLGCEAYAAVGLHPHEARLGTEAVVALAEGAAGRAGSRLVAIGECGLDYHYDHSPRPAQRQAFAEQIDLAKRLGLALVIHTREAWGDTLDILRAEGPPAVTVIHCFTGGPTEARACLDLGAFLSFSGIVTFKNAGEVREAAVLCPAERLLVETDAPFLAPVPHRGQPNRPAWVRVVGEAVAALRGVDPSELAARTTANTRAAFGLPASASGAG